MPERIEEELMADESGTKIREPYDSIDQSVSGGGSSQYDWRRYFTLDELTAAFNKIQSGGDPNDDEETEESREETGSDSCPSDDNLDLKQLYDIIYC